MIQVRSIHCKRTNVEEVHSGCYVCLGIKKIENLSIRRGHVIISPHDRTIQASEFEADIVVLRSHSTTIKIGYEPVVHTCSIRQTARLISIKNKESRINSDSEILRTGDKARMRFRFCYKPEFIRPGFRILLAEGPVKIIGKIVHVEEENIKIA